MQSHCFQYACTNTKFLRHNTRANLDLIITCIWQKVIIYQTTGKQKLFLYNFAQYIFIFHSVIVAMKYTYKTVR